MSKVTSLEKLNANPTVVKIHYRFQRFKELLFTRQVMSENLRVAFDRDLGQLITGVMIDMVKDNIQKNTSTLEIRSSTVMLNVLNKLIELIEKKHPEEFTLEVENVFIIFFLAIS